MTGGRFKADIERIVDTADAPLADGHGREGARAHREAQQEKRLE
jgi:hypothetical protein